MIDKNELKMEEFRSKIVAKRRIWSRPQQVQNSIGLTEAEVTDFLSLLDTDPIIKAFHLQDACCNSSDRYLIAMVMVYFKRSGLDRLNYNRYNFFAALYLAHDMEEDIYEMKYEILPWALGRHWKENFWDFIAAKNSLWKNMNFSAFVSQRTCEQIFLMPAARDHPAFMRFRRSDHGFVSDLRLYSLEESSASHESPQGPLWKNFHESVAKLDEWSSILGMLNWKGCYVCHKNPFSVWNEANAWPLFDEARDAMARMEEEMNSISGLEMFQSFNPSHSDDDDETFDGPPLKKSSLKCNNDDSSLQETTTTEESFRRTND